MLQELQLRGLLSGVITYNAAISACEKGQMPQQALHLLQEMLLRGLLPNVITYNAAISVCEKGQKPHSPTAPWPAPVRRAITYSALISVCEKGYHLQCLDQ